MKKEEFFMLALAAIAFVACSNEDIVPGGKDNNDVVNLDGDAWVALSVQSTKTRALNTRIRTMVRLMRVILLP